MNGVTYADLHMPVLLKHSNAELVVVGSHSPDDWGRAIAAVGGRIYPLPNQSDPTPMKLPIYMLILIHSYLRLQ